jgi:hypothetical protein
LHWFRSWLKPGLTVDRVQRYCTKKPQTTYGYQKLIKKNIQSTQINHYTHILSITLK